MSEVNDFKQFLADAGLAKFSDLLLEDGYDNVDMLREISEEELVKFGFGGGHKKKLQQALEYYYEAAGSGHKAVSAKKKKSVSETAKSGVVVAMVVGIGDYVDEAKCLEAPERDALMVCKMFKQYGVEVFKGEPILHPRKLELKDQLQDFYAWSKTKQPLTSIFYFSGHGCQFGDETHLITKEYPDDEDDLKEDAALSLSRVRKKMSGKLKVVILDCCRARMGAKSAAPPIRLKEQDVPKGELTVFACGAAHKAGGGHNPLSTFTSAFMEIIGKKDCSVHRLFQDVRDEVIDDTDGKQKPEVFYNPEDGEAYGEEGCHVCLFPGLGDAHKGARGVEQDAATMGSDDDDDDDDDDRRPADQEAERRRLEEEAAERQSKEAERRRLEEEAAERQRKELERRSRLEKEAAERQSKGAVVDDAVLISSIQQMVNETYAGWGFLGPTPSTRDRRNPLATSLKVEEVVHIANAANYLGYCRRREEVRAEFERCPERERTKDWIVKSGKVSLKGTALHAEEAVDTSINEFWLWHGSADGITDTGFDLGRAERAVGTMFGRGLYFSESCMKADEYTVADDRGWNPLILCRVTLGRMYYCDAKKPYEMKDVLEDACHTKGYHCVLGDREVVRGTFREFIVFDKDQVYPEYVVWYSRTPPIIRS